MDTVADINMAQIVVTALLSSGFVGGILTLVSKKVWSPESKNELARLGNDFAHQLLIEAREERNELRLTIAELENSNTTKEETIRRLQRLAEEKDAVIRDLEERQFRLAEKLRDGEVITLRDIFGPRAPAGFDLEFPDIA